ncbi:uncharacterized protein LOC143025350 isoform X2 [Oratosquilla oratoria]|uniref:uncharacterized protein LOC143025350 isoform X2 n=1 Tax=Oratosquilla oratoria TaxID=337810 RepID=UPI003F775982
MDIEKLICEVQCRTALYNATEPAYANRDLKEQLWKDVSEAMMRPVEECKKKWKTIRDGFMRELKLQQQPGAVTKRKPYIHFAQLTFLIPHVQYKNDPTNNSLMSIDKHEYDEHDESRPNGSYEVYVDEQYDPPTPQCELSLDSISNMSDSTAQRKKRKVDPSQEYFENRLLEILEKKNITAPQPELDEDEHFFKSLIPTMKKLDPETRSLLKIRIAQMVHETVFASQGHSGASQQTPCITTHPNFPAPFPNTSSGNHQ